MNLLKNKNLLLDDDILLKNLQQLLYKTNINEAELGRRTNIPHSTIHKIFSGKTTDPRISTLKTLADFFNVTVDNLYSEDISELVKKEIHGQSVPIISWRNCLESKRFVPTLSANNWQDWVVIEQMNSELIYALSTKPTMEPRFPKGTILIIDPQNAPEDGDLVVVSYPEADEAALRELVIDGPNKLLTPINTNSSSDKLAGNIIIIGTVIQSRFSFED